VAVDVYWFLPMLGPGTFRERWPYGPGTTFHPDLAVEVDPAVRTANPVVAPVSGTLIILPDATLKTCGVFLIPSPDVTKAFVHDGIGELAFFLRTLDLADLVQRFKASVTATRPSGVTVDQQVQNLTEGKLPVDVIGGEDIALLAPVSATDQHGLAQFEVLFAPRRGSYVGQGRAITYAKRLVDPANRYRRLDPMAFYYRVKRGGAFDTRIAPAHAAHPFWTAPFTRRGLLEVRDERDRPFATAVQLETAGGPAQTITLTAANWAHYEASPAGAPGRIDLRLSKPSWRLTLLPTWGKSSSAPTNQQEVPFHWAVQGIYMDAAANAASWFVPNTAPLSLFTEQNTVAPLVDGIATYAEIVSWLKLARRAEQFVWLAGWWCDDTFAMVPGDTTTEFRELAKSIDLGHAQIRVILWEQTTFVLPGSGRRSGRKTNSQTVNDINALPGGNGFAILDAQTKKAGSHHQKFMVVYLDPANAVAFCGGIDINPNRLDTPEHGLKWAYHDVHAKLTGPVVQDFARLFRERWNDHNDVIADQSKQLGGVGNPSVNQTTGDCFVQLTRTMPRGTHRSVINGVQGTYNAVRNAVRKAERYIYIEDQYLFPYWGHVPFNASLDIGIVQDLIDALKRIKFLIIVIPNHAMTPQMRYRRREFLEALTRAAGTNASKMHVYYLKRKKPAKEPSELADDDEFAEREMSSQGMVVPPNATPEQLDALGGSGASGGRGYSNEIYVHTKIWIVDDVYLKCGSMNVNRRGFTYDSEADFHAVDGAVTRGMRRTALNFRQTLFAEHARKAPEDVPDDADDLLAWWLDRAAASGRVGNYSWRFDVDLPPALRPELDLAWQNIIDPDGR
jgi:phosphatidylserine/phosphatidylglycerophosphate/cardiolipin synthase-like enzyme